MIGLGVAICSYSIRMYYVGRTKQFLKIGTKKIKTQLILVTSASQKCTGAKPPYLMKVLYQTKILNREMGIQIDVHNTLCLRRLAWMSETLTQIELIDVGHY